MKNETFKKITHEYKMDLYFGTTFGSLIPIIWHPLDVFTQTLYFDLEINNQNIILFSVYLLSNMLYFRHKKIFNTISNFLGILSYTLLSIPIFNILTMYIKDNVNYKGIIISLILTLFIKIIKYMIDKNIKHLI